MELKIDNQKEKLNEKTDKEIKGNENDIGLEKEEINFKKYENLKNKEKIKQDKKEEREEKEIKKTIMIKILRKIIKT